MKSLRIIGSRVIAALLSALAASLAAQGVDASAGPTPTDFASIIGSGSIVYGIAHKVIDSWLNPTDVAAPSEVVEKADADGQPDYRI